MYVDELKTVVVYAFTVEIHAVSTARERRRRNDSGSCREMQAHTDSWRAGRCALSFINQHLRAWPRPRCEQLLTNCRREAGVRQFCISGFMLFYRHHKLFVGRGQRSSSGGVGEGEIHDRQRAV